MLNHASFGRTQAKFKDCLFLKFLFYYLITIKRKMWTVKEADSEGANAVASNLASTLRMILYSGE
jgi:hypothetical protein